MESRRRGICAVLWFEAKRSSGDGRFTAYPCERKTSGSTLPSRHPPRPAPARRGRPAHGTSGDSSERGTPPFLRGGRAGRNCTPTRRMHTVFDFAATRPAYLARAPRHRGRAAPPDATRVVGVSAMGVVDIASQCHDILTGLIGSTAAADMARSAAPSEPLLIPSPHLRDDPAR